MPRLIRLRDFTYCDESGTAVTRVKASELKRLFAALAEHHGWQVDELLANSEVPADKRLPCRVVRNLPDGSSWWAGQSKYIVAKLQRSPVAAGRSFARAQSDNGEWRGRCTVGKKRKVAEVSAQSPPQRPKRAHSTSHIDDSPYSFSPGSPGDGREGCVHPLPILLHRAAYLSARPDPSAPLPSVVRHVCGRSKCAVVAHYRGGTAEANERDRKHHLNHRGMSREAFTTLQ